MKLLKIIGIHGKLINCYRGAILDKFSDDDDDGDGEDDDDSIDTDALDDDIANDQWNKLVSTVF